MCQTIPTRPLPICLLYSQEGRCHRKTIQWNLFWETNVTREHVLTERELSKFNGTSTPKGSYRAKTGDNDCNVNSSHYGLSTALCESIRYQAKSEQNVRQDIPQDLIPRVGHGEAALSTPIQDSVRSLQIFSYLYTCISQNWQYAGFVRSQALPNTPLC